jgi:hypothetical protein
MRTRQNKVKQSSSIDKLTIGWLDIKRHNWLLCPVQSSNMILRGASYSTTLHSSTSFTPCWPSIRSKQRATPTTIVTHTHAHTHAALQLYDQQDAQRSKARTESRLHLGDYRGDSPPYDSSDELPSPLAPPTEAESTARPVVRRMRKLKVVKRFNPAAVAKWAVAPENGEIVYLFLRIR